jgi:hypothetical protein
MFPNNPNNLLLLGYELYFIGCEHYMKVKPAHVMRGYLAVNVPDKCNLDQHAKTPTFVWTNLLAVHSAHANPRVLQLVRDSAKAHARMVRAAHAQPLAAA